jgi:hypothetical protein
MFSSCRCSPPSSAAPASSRRRSPGSHCQAGRNHAASPRALSSAVSSASGRPRLLARASASVISELASRMRCPVRGSVLPSCLGLRRRRAHLGRSQSHRGVPAHGQRRRPCVRPQGNLLAYQVPKRGHLYPHKGKRRARIVSPLSEETAGSHRGVPVRNNVRLRQMLSGSAPADALHSST